MKTKQSISIISTSALAAGMAQGAVTHSGPLNIVMPCPDDWSVLASEIDMNGDFYPDFYVGFDGVTSSNWRKPFVDCRNLQGAAPRTQPDSGAPVTEFGTMIDGTYLTPSPTQKAYLSQNGDGALVGDWSQTALTEAYVGVQLFSTANSTTNFGWIHLIYSSATVSDPPLLTLVDWAYETTPGAGIPAGSTNTLGAPDIYLPPQPQTVPAGGVVEFKVNALGQPNPSYQWKARAVGGGTFTNLVDGGTISGANSRVLRINGALPGNTAEYAVLVSNASGSAPLTAPAALTVGPPVASPGAQSLFSGVTARFDVAVASGLSPTYQWRKNNSNLSNDGRIGGANTAHLEISGITATDDGNYDVVLTIGSLSLTSSVAPLTVLPVESNYEAILLSANPHAYYRLNETGSPGSGNLRATDNAGTFGGVYGTQVGNGVAGPRAADGFPGFRSDNTAAQFTKNVGGSRITLAPWNLNTDTMTIACWLKPAAGDQNESAGIVYSISTNKVNVGLNYYWATNAQTEVRSIGYNWRDENDLLWDSGFRPPPDRWSFVALVIEPTRGTIYVFNTDGTTSGFYEPGAARAPIPFNVPAYIGTDPTWASGKQNFNGIIDEVAIFNKALQQSELETIYNAALGVVPVTIQAEREGNNIRLSWPVGSLLEASGINGPWTTNSAASPYVTPMTGSAKFYKVLVP